MASSSLFSHLLLFLLLHAMLLIPSYAQANGHITLGSFLTAQINQTDAWHSPSGEFAFGFRPLETNNSLFLLAIWFAKIADSTVVWYANGSLPVQAGSKVELTIDGKLNLTDPAGEAVWSATDISDASYAAMLDTGNFMIMGADKSVRWQTFDHPSDTILPSQVLGPDHELSSRLSDTDYSDGTFTLGIQSDGNLAFYNLSVSPPAAYWTSGTDGRVSQLVFDESGSIYLSLKDGELLNFTSARNYSTRDFYQRARLDPLGVFRQYVYPKNGTTDVGWTPVDFQPDICTIFVDGACGQNSYCKSRGNESYDCICLPEYFYVNPNEKDQGCQQNFPRQNCDDVELGAQFDFIYMYHVDWPYGDYSNMDGDEDKCREECLRDCDCLVAIYQNSTELCWKKKLPVSNGMMGAGVDRTALIKVPSSAPEGSQKSDSGKRKILMVIIITSVLGFLLLVSVALYLWKKNRKQVPMLGIPNASNFNEGEGEELLELPLFDLFAIESATDCFSINNKLGEGGFGPVYKGQLEDGQEIAVKRLSTYSVHGLDQFKNEVVLIAKLQHRNLVRLLGCCIQGEERLLIYEYMQNKSLDSFIFDKMRRAMLSWPKRLDIIIGIARGLLYLHQDSRLKIIHRDLKAGNVLLDKDMNPKISDFGIARIFQGDQNQENTRKVVGTFGYMSPEYATDGIFSVKSDVFSFGVLILEILSGKKNKIMYHEGYNSMNLIGQAWRLWEEGRCLELLDEAMECPYPISKGLRCIQVGLLCVQEESEDRPTMAEVVLMLSNEGVALPQPKRPGFCISKSLIDRDSSSTSKQHLITANEITVTMLEGR